MTPADGTTTTDHPASGRQRLRVHEDFLLLLTTFISFRLAAVWFQRPGGYIRDYSDLIFYRSRASWQEFGFLPYRDYWSEYPPLFAWFSVWIDNLARRFPVWEDERFWYAAFFGAAIVGLLASSRTFLQTSLGFLAGGLYGSEWRDFRAMLPYIVPGFAGAMLLSGRLNILALGDDIAAGLGVVTDRTRLAILAVVGVLTAMAVATAGLVSFVGLVCPHLARYTVGGDNRALIPVSALYGALLVSLADLIARLVISPSEVPMGIITAGVGAPFLLYLVRFRD